MDYKNKPDWLTSDTWYKKIKETPWLVEAYIRDNFTCQDCGLVASGKKRVFNFPVGEKESTDASDFVTLCRRCILIRRDVVSKRGRIYFALISYLPDKKVRRGVLKVIAEEMGVTRERVRQVAEIHGFQAARETERKVRTIHCIVCEKLFVKITKSQVFCSGECRSEFSFYKYNELLVCKNCKLGFLGYKNPQRLTRSFCSKKCQGIHLGVNFGTQALYKNIKRVKKDFPGYFGLETFAIKYGYKTNGTAHSALEILIKEGFVEKVSFGLYRVIKTK